MNQNGTFTMSNTSQITGNAVTNGSGGGVYVNLSSTFNMSGGTISGNKVSTTSVNPANGGGVYNGSTFEMSGGTISGNNASTDGGGVYSGSTFKISGTSQITGNAQGGTIANGALSGGTANNLFLAKDKLITVTGVLSAQVGSEPETHAKIGVTLASDYGDVPFTSGYTTSNNVTPTDHFFTDDGRDMVLDHIYNEVKIIPHTHAGSTVEFKKVLTSTGGNLVSGTYYLTGNLKLENNLIVGTSSYYTANVTICLNGYKLQGTGKGSVITVKSGSILNLHDCQGASTLDEHQHKYTVDTNGKFVYDDNASGALSTTGGVITGGVITSGVITSGGGVDCTESAEFNMYGGTIAGNSAVINGGGVYIGNNGQNKGGTFKMSGGTISGNTASKGGGVYVSYGTFNLSGSAQISQNTATNGGGVYVALDTESNYPPTPTVFTMSENAKISQNTASTSGGGVYNYKNIFNLSGSAQISQNTANTSGGGVYHNGNTFNLSGTPQIIDNVIDGTVDANGNLSGGTASNVRLFYEKLITVKGALSAQVGSEPETHAKIGVTLASNYGDVPFTSGYTTSGNTADPSQHFIADNKMPIVLSGGEAKSILPHTHNGEMQKYDKILSEDSENLTTGHYFLLEDVVLKKNLTIPAGSTVNLCLNGYKLQGKSGSSAITVNGTSSANGDLTIHDCQGASILDEHQHKYNVDTNGKFVYDDNASGTLSTTGGVITGGSATTGGGIKVSTYSTLTINGGTIAGNTAETGGGVHNSFGTLKITGGTIAGNTAMETETGGVIGAGGGVWYNGFSFTMTGGTISQNTAVHGAGIFFKGTKFEMSGGTISNNTATGNGGGVALSGGTAGCSISGTAKISGNTAVSGGGVRIDGGTLTMSGGIISGNTALAILYGTPQEPTGGVGGGVSVAIGTFNMSGGEISGNTAQHLTDNNVTAGGLGGGVHVNSVTTFTVSGGTIGGTETTHANTASKSGGGVYFAGTTFKVSGSPKITGNTTGSGSTLSNLHFADISNKITVTASLGADAAIGISPNNSRVVTAGYGANNTTGHHNNCPINHFLPR